MLFSSMAPRRPLMAQIHLIPFGLGRMRTIYNSEQPAPQDHHDISDAQVLQHTAEQEQEEEEEGQDQEEHFEEERVNQPRLLTQHEWDGTTEPSLDTLRYTVE